MNDLTEKVVKTALILAMPATFITVAYLLNNQPVRELIVKDSTPYRVTKPQLVDSLQTSGIQADLERKRNSLKLMSALDSNVTFLSNNDSATTTDTSLLAGKDSIFPEQNDKTITAHDEALRGPSALFTRTYSLEVGKPVSVSISWLPDSAQLPVKIHLVTVTVNDIVGDKAGFTLSDPSAILVYSGPNYAVNDKISIEDENHNLHISVLQVYPDFVKIQLTSYLNDKLVNKLNKWQ